MDKFLMVGGQSVSTLPAVSPYETIKSMGYYNSWIGSGYLLTEEFFTENFIKSYEIIEHDLHSKVIFYKHKELDFYIDFRVSNIIGYLFYKVSDEGVVDKMTELFTPYKEKSPSKIHLLVKTDTGFEAKARAVKPLELCVDTMYNDSFKAISETIVKRLNNDSKGLVMLHGQPGTGKTNYIKWLTTQVEKRFFFIPNNMINHLVDPGFMNFILQHTNIILVLEDCESFIKERTSSGDTSVVSTILNLSDGILSDVLNIQIICTFNAKISAIDKALLRKGRMLAKYEFTQLDKGKAQNLADSMGIELPKDLTLASLFNAKEESYMTEESKIGF